MNTRPRDLRKNATDAERCLWKLLRSRQLEGYKFRRQHPVGRYILDFYCHAAGLVIEVDGGGHYSEHSEHYDLERTAYLDGKGMRVLRFTNSEVLGHPIQVCEAIFRVLRERCPHPDPLPEGEGT